MNNSKSNSLSDLRKKAEEAARNIMLELDSTSEDQVRKLAAELQIHRIELEMQNEELRRAQQESEQLYHQFYLIFNNAPAGYLILDENALIEHYNDTFLRMLNRDSLKLTGSALTRMIEEDDREIFIARYKAFFKNPGGKSFDVRIRRPDNTSFYARIEGAPAPVFNKDNIIDELPKLLLIISDITEQKEQEMIIRTALQEKEVLLRELYHRSKNNMQIICSMIALKSLSLSGEHEKRILADIENKIQSMALVHQKLYQSKNLSRVDLKTYIVDLVELLSSSFGTAVKRINFRLELECVPVLIDTAVPIGLIINELVTNSFKYAFKESETGEILIRLAFADNEFVELAISDNGCGFPEGQDVKTTRTLGMQLLFALVNQLHGTIDYRLQGGTLFTIRFKDIFYKARI